MVNPLVSDHVFGPNTTLTVYAPVVALEDRLNVAVTTPVPELRLTEVPVMVVAPDFVKVTLVGETVFGGGGGE